MKTYFTKFVVSLVAFIAVVGGIFAYVARSGSTTVPDTLPTPIPATTVPLPVAENPAVIPDTRTSKYKDGTYTAVGNYESPEGAESVNVQITLVNDIVTNSSVTGNASGGRSARYQQNFISGYKTFVIGQNIDTLSLNRVSGSSLTPVGFNDALSQIKTKARV